MTAKKVSKKYALNEFMTIGLILVVYCLFALYIPIVLNELFSTEYMQARLTTNLMEGIKTLIIIVGTLLPFILISYVGKRKKRQKVKVIVPFSMILVESFVFFTISSLAVFVTTSVAAYLGIAGELVSPIGMPLTSENMQSPIYVVSFILITPVVEEYAYRGAFLNCLSKYGKYFASIATSLIFAIAHGSFVEMVPAFVMGYELSKIALKYKNWKTCASIHVIFNAFLYLLFAVPEDYSKIMAILLFLIYAITVVLILNRHFQRITIRKSRSSNDVIKMFFKTGSVILASVLFIINSILSILLR